MILVCGASGELGGRIVRRLRASGAPVRALVRRRADATALSEMGVELTQGDFRDSESLRRAVVGVTTVASTVTVIARALAGDKEADFHQVDLVGHRELIAAAETAGVERFVFVSVHAHPCAADGQPAPGRRQDRDGGPAYRLVVA